MSDHIILNVHLTAAAGKEEYLAQELHKLLAPTRAEPGCAAYELYRDSEDPAKFMFHEIFRGQAALDAHLATPHFKHFLEVRASQTPDPVAGAVVTRWKMFA